MSGSQSGAANAENVNGYGSGSGSTRRRLGFWRGWTTKEDWWPIWIGWGLVLVAYILYTNGGSIRWLAVAPARWASVSDAAHFFASHLPNYVALLAVFGVLFSIAAAALGQRVAYFVPSFLIVFAGSIVIFTLGAWVGASKYNLEPPLVALAAGLVLSNVFKLPEWFHAGLRVELYIKVGSSIRWFSVQPGGRSGTQMKSAFVYAFRLEMGTARKLICAGAEATHVSNERFPLSSPRNIAFVGQRFMESTPSLGE